MKKRATYERLLRLEDALVARYRSAREIADGREQNDVRTKAEASLRRCRRKLWAVKDKLDALALACRAMIAEQGLTACDVPWCGSAAAFTWTRTPADMKKQTRKYKGKRLEPSPVDYRCHDHVPHFAPEWASRFVPVALPAYDPACAA